MNTTNKKSDAREVLNFILVTIAFGLMIFLISSCSTNISKSTFNKALANTEVIRMDPIEYKLEPFDSDGTIWVNGNKVRAFMSPDSKVSTEISLDRGTVVNPIPQGKTATYTQRRCRTQVIDSSQANYASLANVPLKVGRAERNWVKDQGYLEKYQEEDYLSLVISSGSYWPQEPSTIGGLLVGDCQDDWEPSSVDPATSTPR